MGQWRRQEIGLYSWICYGPAAHHEINQNSHYLSDFLFKYISCNVPMQYIALLSVSSVLS